MAISFYNGYRFDSKAKIDAHGRNCVLKTQMLNRDIDLLKAKDLCTKYRMNQFNILIDIPPWEDDLNLYNATLAHKVNNDFEPEINALFGSIDHPRFGLIPAVVTTRKIAKNEEILLDYGYMEETRSQAEWYFEFSSMSSSSG